MTERVRCSLEQLPKLVHRRIGRLERDVQRATGRTSRAAVSIIKGRTPKAFGDLRDSVHAVGDERIPRTIVDAPHAASVEVGSAPHMPDIEKLTAWVKLRGLQGLHSRGLGNTRRHGPTTKAQALRVKDLLAAEVQRGHGGDYSPTDAPEKVALAIAKGIQKHGTRPHWFVRDSLPDIAKVLNEHVRKALGK